MKTLVLLFMIFTVALGMPAVPRDPVREGKSQPAVAGDRVPVQGHVVVEHPAPQVLPDPKEQQEKTAPAEQKEKEAQPETKLDELQVEAELEPEQEPAPEGEAEPVEGPDVQVASKVNVEVKGQPQYELEEEEEEEKKEKRKGKEEEKGKEEKGKEKEDEDENEEKGKGKEEDDEEDDDEEDEEEKGKGKEDEEEDDDEEDEEEKGKEKGKEKEDEEDDDEEDEEEKGKGKEKGKEKEDEDDEEEDEEEKGKGKEEEIDRGFKVRSAPRVDAGAHMELEPEETPELNEAPETFQARADGGVGPEMGVEERHIDMEGKPLAVMELEPLDDADMPAEEVSEMSEEEMAYREAFQEQDPPAAAAELFPEEEEEEEEDKVDGEEDFKQKYGNNVPDEQEIMELEPELTGEQNPEDAPDAAVLAEEPADPAPQQTRPLSENYFPEEEAGMGMHARDGAPGQEEQGMGDEGLPMMMGDDSQRQGGRYCTGLIVDGKCYQFFKEPLNYEDAEFFCQEQFLEGHLGAITTQHVHQELMSLRQQSGGHTRTWVGGRRLDRRFVWLDGSRWSYEDWLPGEPNHTAGVENCVEILGNGKFNDFTCWEAQAFVCSYPV